MKKFSETMAALLLAGSLFFCTGTCGKVKRGVTAQGIEVGGLPLNEAVRLAREEIARTLPPLVIETPRGIVEYGYPALSFTDDLPRRLARAKKGEKVEADVVRTWADAEDSLLLLCASFAREGRDASLHFDGTGFTYFPETDGVYCDYARLLSDCTRALSTGEKVRLAPKVRPPAVTERKLREQTRLISSFTTSFSAAAVSRAHNVRLAAERIGGSIVPPGGEFSFNRTVGKRTRENGFEEAAVIQNGAFVQGVGGGVCQTSTTLFNAAVRAGMEIKESHPHSLTVGYVPPSLDAMVSETSDMRFVNPRPYPVYILARTGRSTLSFEFYSLPDGRRYETESRILRRVLPPPAERREGTENRTVRPAREGLVSESYLLIYEKGTLLSRTLIRRDAYACVRGIEEYLPTEESAEGQILP